MAPDAWQQAQEEKQVRQFSKAKPGDLVFFDNKEEIVHAGILSGDEKIIHRSGGVRINKIDNKGIIDAAKEKRVLSLKAVRWIL